MKTWMRNWARIALLLSAATACSAGPTKPADGAFAHNPDLARFIQEMVDKHGMDKNTLQTLFAGAQLRDDILRAISRPAEGKPWYEYRPIFLTRSRIDGGVTFWEENEAILAKAEQELGVDAQIIVAIIGVETRYGGNTGSYRVLDALATLGFEYPPRASFFRSELEQFLLLSREEQVDIEEAKGSYAGAMGQGQFIPSSYRRYAVDFDGDGRRDLWNSQMDIIGSVANYLHVHGWVRGAPIAEKATLSKPPEPAHLEAGTKPSLLLGELRKQGIRGTGKHSDDTRVSLLKYDQADGLDYWIGFNNFYVITRYNRSQLYAMAVYQLSEEIRQAREAGRAR